MVKRDYKKLIANGDNATTFMTGVMTRKRSIPGYIMSSYKRNTNDAYGYKPSYVSAAWLDLVDITVPTHSAGNALQEANDLALVRFVQRANQAMQSFKGLQYLGEAAESIHMIRNNTVQVAKETYRFLHDVKRLVRGKPVARRRRPNQTVGGYFDQLQRVFNNRYLEYTFGVKPLVADTQKAAETLAKIHEGPGDHRMVSATGNALGNVFVTPATFFVSAQLRAYYNIETVTRAAVTYRGVVRTTLASISDVNKFIGLDWTDIVPTLWEVLPGSFVLDYVSNISDIIDAASFKRSSMAWVAKSTLTETVRKISDFTQDKGYPGNAFAVYDQVDAQCTAPDVRFLYRTVTRDTYIGSLIPDFQLSVPGVKAGINIAALANMCRLTRKNVRQALTRR